MDASPLVQAHDHAAAATRQAADSTVAISEHAHAAGEFANAARHTSSVEALRTLKLLEDHHRRLAALLGLPPQAAPSAVPSADRAAQGSHAVEDAAATGGKAPPPPPSKPRSVVAVVDKAVSPRRDPPARAAAVASGRSQPQRFASRDMSSSIASNLASARGIRSKYRGQPLSPSVSSDQAPGNVDPHPRRDGSRTRMQTIMDRTGKPAWVPPTPSPSSSPQQLPRSGQSSPRVDADSTAVDEGGYSRFYNTFGSLITKMSAPLAFAGLPLIQESSLMSRSASTSDAPAPASPTPRSPKRKSSRAPSAHAQEPDLSKIYSKATMMALARDGHAASDSFYVVPTSGHTMSYANILSYAEKEKRRFGVSANGEALGPGGGRGGDDDDFVDARETPASFSPGAVRRKAAGAPGERELRNHIEELSLENRSLKDMLDNVSKRLHVFEASSQHSAMALAESYRFMRPGSPCPQSAGGRLADEALRRRARDAEEQLAAMAKQVERLERDNRKMQRTLDKYREKWETLKAGAKARRGAQVGESVEDARQS